MSWSNIGDVRGVENEKKWAKDRALCGTKENSVELGGFGAHMNWVGSVSQGGNPVEAVMPHFKNL